MLKHKRLHLDQRGFTLVEMLVVVALVGIIAAGIAMTISQVMAVNSRTSSHMVALRQVQQAGDRISKDVLQAQVVGFGDDPVGTKFPLSLTWVDMDNTKNEVTYTITADNRLRRHIKVTPAGEAPTPTEIVTYIAQYIDVTINPDTTKPNTYLSPDGRFITFTVTATVGMRSETRVYEMEPRPGS